MNYIALINQYWQLREQGILDAGCGDLYLYLIHKSNSLGWKNPFNQSNSIIRSVINVSEPTLIRQRNVLKQLRLIEFESGKATRKTSLYTIINAGEDNYLNNLSRPVSSVVSSVDEKTLDNTKHKTKQNKTKEFTPPSLEEFLNHAKSELIKLKYNWDSNFDYVATNKFNAWNASNWINGKTNKPMKDWRATLSNTMPYLVESWSKIPKQVAAVQPISLSYKNRF